MERNSGIWGLLLRGVVLAFLACGFLMADWLSFPWSSLAGMGVVGAVLLVVTGASQEQDGGIERGLMIAACIGSLVVPLGLWLEKGTSRFPDLPYTLLAWAMAAAAFVAARRGVNAGKLWRALAMAWAFGGAILWVFSTYVQNERLAFHLAVVVLAGLLIFWKVAFRLKAVVAMGANTLLLFLVLLPMVDLFVRPSYSFEADSDDGRRLYSYEVARSDPSAFAAWWGNYVEQFHKMIAELGNSGSNQQVGVFAPHAHAKFFQSDIRINNLGFRGPDCDAEKGDAYRIVALGESTTFGATIRSNDVPWPEVLERMIRERIKSTRPVQVINAGVSAMTLPGNVERLAVEIFPLKPDMIISYHGINGFGLFDRAMPRIFGYKQPKYEARPLKILADAEYGIKMSRFRRELVPKNAPFRFGTNALSETEYAAAYRDLIRAAASNQVKLVLANFSMAANAGSPPDVVTFYRAGFPSVHWQMEANQLHSTLIANLGREYTNVYTLDSQTELDGHHEKFIDLIHMTQEGRVQMAENVFAGIKGLLEEELRVGGKDVQ